MAGENDDKDVPTKFLELPSHTRKFLANLSEEDVKLAHETIQLANAVRRVIKAMAWLVVTAVGSFITGTLFVEQWTKIKGWLTGVVK